ncbi:hypothetical protein ROZALSC1DRAFT_20711 [Rozella allomycis CSF55]|uniref:N-acetylgalactosaminide beta-1,3-galactosyltransferase n=1 Tax=Rozella allomycis (strain CSF55) TaxID=988480 RepID=A0A4P9YPM0_ROZAC|nr:hypothetical protein ROZALSC1DRAFT_20711 [Rozella allomycis CSF55]
MGSKAKRHRSVIAKNTWHQWAEKIIIFGDEMDLNINMVTLSDLKGKWNYTDAQHRQLKGMKWLHENRTNLTKTYDDTWVNVPATIHFLSQYDSRLLTAFGYIWDKLFEKDEAFHSGGAGIILSYPAFSKVSDSLYTDKCPFMDWNDVTIANCLYRTGVFKVHKMKISMST